LGKKVARSAKIVLSGHDISQHVKRWSVVGEIGDVYRVQLDVHTGSSCPVAIKNGGNPAAPYIKANGDVEWRTPSHRNIPYNDTILVNGTDVSSCVYRHELVRKVGEAEYIRLYVHADSELLSINGGHPWEEPED
jgi:hypothetical protein